MKNYYVNNTIKGQVVYFSQLNELVRYLGEVLVPMAYNQTKSQYTQYLAELGHGYDDGSGVVLTRALSETFDIGVVKDGKLVKTDVHTATYYLNEGYGD